MFSFYTADGQCVRLGTRTWRMAKGRGGFDVVVGGVFCLLGKSG